MLRAHRVPHGANSLDRASFWDCRGTRERLRATNFLERAPGPRPKTAQRATDLEILSLTARYALPRSLGPLRLLPLLLLLAAAPLHAADICNDGTLPLCFDAGAPDLLSGSDVTRFTAADDFVLITNGEEVALRVDFWTLEGNLDWDETLEYFIFEDVADSQSQNGRSPAATPLYSGMGQAMTREFTGRTGEPALPEFKEYKYSFRLDGPVSLNSGQVY